MARHVESLFSQAYDRELRGNERDAFETHLASCATCHTAYAEYRSALSAVKTMPTARMPVAVHLPSTPPVAAQIGIVDRLRGLSTRFRYTVGAAVIAAAVVILSLTTFRAGAGTSLAVTSPGSRVPDAAAATPLTVAGQAQDSSSCAPSALGAAGSGGAPAEFGNSVTRSDPSRPNQALTLATTSTRVSPGQTVLVYSRLTVPVTVSAPQGSKLAVALPEQSLPCVTLVGGPLAGANSQPLSNAAGAVAAPQAAAVTRSLATVMPTFDVTFGNQPLQAVTIPPGLAPGTVIQLVAAVPADYPQAGGAALVATVTLTVD